MHRATTCTLLFVRSVASRAHDIRLYAPSQPLVAHATLSLADDQRHYLANVMRAKAQEQVKLFNGEDGEWMAAIEVLDKRRCEVRVLDQIHPQPPPAPGPTLLFGVLKGQRLPSLVEKSTELGVGELVPVVMQHCAARSLKTSRLQAIAVEASEQSRRLTVPTVREATPLAEALAKWDSSRVLFLCDERAFGAGSPALSEAAAALGAGAPAPGVLIGPEGGLSPDERQQLEACAFVHFVSLGANTLRAETAAMAACAVLACSRT